MSNYKIEFLKTAEKEFYKLPQQIQKTIAKKLEYLKTNPYPSNVKALKNGQGRLRLRVGDYRIIYRVETDVLVILVIKVGHRKNIYRN
ncbi:MAG: type II toxin-antitoxin system RelE/ParE family toxin [Xenococcaceae cyanobacterium MO_167.B52]|nr:type II toxin-antitoxin system RelE/ParE family toxin [Xenococcaceae cyanobacterium MO_167.B52]